MSQRVGNISDRVLARTASAALRGAACTGMRREWDNGEIDVEAARTRQEAWSAAADLLAVCHGCDVVARCLLWAELERYTGVAGGQVLANGKPRRAPVAANRRLGADRELAASA